MLTLEIKLTHLTEMTIIECKNRIFKYDEVYWVDFDEDSIKSEVRKLRPALIISNNIYNKKK